MSAIFVEAPRSGGVPGTTVQFTATAFDSIGQAISGVSFDWRSSDASVAGVDQTGLVTAIRPGTIQITARANAIEAGSPFEVLQLAGAVALTAARAPVVPTAAFRLPFQVQSESGAPLDSANREFVWRSSDPSVAGVDEAGLITTVAPGSTTITLTAAVEAVSASAPLEVAFLSYRTVQEGRAYSCGLTTGGRVYCWGDDYYGVLDDGTYVRDPVPWPLATDILFDSLSVGAEHACGLTPAGRPYCWGSNLYGALGDGTTALRFTPLPVQGDLTLSSVVVGGRYTCGLDDTGAAYCWGWNEWGNLGVGDREASIAPRPAAVGLQLATISLSTTGPSTGPHTCGMTVAGEAYCWGSNELGQLATYPLTRTVDLPAPVQSPSALVAIESGAEHGCGLTDDGTALCWGSNTGNALGDRDLGELNIDSIPAPVPGAPAFVTLRAGRFRTCGLTAAGDVYCWGDLFDPVPRLIDIPEPITRVDVSAGRFCGMSNQNVAYCWNSPNVPAAKAAGQP